MALLAVHAVVLPVAALVSAMPVLHALEALGPAALLALAVVLRERLRPATVAVTLGLLTSSALAVHISGGYVEAHFHFFVMVAVLALYEDWLCFGLALAYVLLHHGIVGTLAPHEVYRHEAGQEHPWRFAAIHAAFIAGSAVAALTTWKLNEDERRRSHAAERRFRLALEYAPVGTALVEKDDRWCEANPALARLLGRSRDDLLAGEPLSSVHRDDRDRLAAALREVRSGTPTAETEIRFVSPQGAVVWALVTVSAVHEEGSRVRQLVLQAQDVTDRRRRADADRLARTVVDGLAEAADAEGALAAAVGPLGAAQGWHTAVLWAPDADGTLRLRRLWAVDPEPVAPFSRACEQLEPGTGLPGQVFSTAEGRYVPVLREEAVFLRQEAAEAAGISAAFVTPLFAADGTVAAVLEFFRGDGPELDDPTRVLFELVAAHIGRRLERDSAQAALSAAAETLQAILDHATAVIHVSDADGRYLLVNRRFEALAGRDRSELLGRTAHDVWSPEVADANAAADTIVLTTGRTLERDEVFVEGDGVHTYYSLRFPLGPGDDGRPRLCTIAVDITDAKRVEEQLRQSNAELEQFAYVASHDLQEPLRMVAGFVQLLQQRYAGQLDDKADRYIALTVEGAERMRTLIDDLLEFSRVGRKAGSAEEIDTTELALEAVALLEAPIAEAGARVEVGELPTVFGERVQLRQVFQNLVSNAVKFRNGEAPVVEISACAEGDGWRFDVCDNGIGIKPEHAERVFMMFQRLHRREEYGGTGIGLAVCRKVVERHGGTIAVTPRDGGGSRFSFSLPRHHRSPA